jgi:hypothetical protein
MANIEEAKVLVEKLESLKKEFWDIDEQITPMMNKMKSKDDLSKEEFEKLKELDKRSRDIMKEQEEIRKQLLIVYK